MPPLTRAFIKSSLLFFVLALTAGLGLAARPVLNLPDFVSALGPVFFHLFMVGWVSQLIFGVAYWMFPKFTREQPRGSERLGWSVFALLNTGLALRAIGEPALALQPASAWGWALALSALLQWLAGLAFVANTWPRVKEK